MTKIDSLEALLQGDLRRMLDEQKATEVRLAERGGCSSAHINQLKNGKTPLRRAKLDIILRLWPQLIEPMMEALSREGGSPVIQIAANSRGSQSVGGDSGRLDAVRAIVGASTLTAEDKIKALKPLLGME